MLAYPDDFPFTLPDDLDMTKIKNQARTLALGKRLRERLTATFWALHPKGDPSDYVEHQIYDGFVERPHERRMAAFHEAPNWSQRYKIANEFQDERLRTPPAPTA